MMIGTFMVSVGIVGLVLVIVGKQKPLLCACVGSVGNVGVVGE